MHKAESQIRTRLHNRAVELIHCAIRCVEHLRTAKTRDTASFTSDQDHLVGAVQLSPISSRNHAMHSRHAEKTTPRPRLFQQLDRNGIVA